MFIRNKYNSICQETLRKIKKGEIVYYDRPEGKVYCNRSQRYKDELNKLIDNETLRQNKLNF